MANPSAGDTVNLTKSNNPTTTGELYVLAEGEDPRAQSTRKRRRLDSLMTNTEIPEKAQRREDELLGDAYVLSEPARQVYSIKGRKEINSKRPRQEDDVCCNLKTRCNREIVSHERGARSPTERADETEPRHAQSGKETFSSSTKRKKQEHSQSALTTHQDTSLRKQTLRSERDEAARLRKTIQWLEEGARRLREDLANARTELHEERRAAKIAKRETDSAIREAKASEAAKYQLIIADLKSRLCRSTSSEVTGTTSPVPGTVLKVEFMKEEHHKREISALKKRLAEAEGTVRRLKWESLNLQTKYSCKAGGTSCAEVRRLETEVRSLRANNEKLEEKLRIALEAEKARTTELRIQHENHEAELSSLRKSLRTETIKMMDELRGKSREIEKLSKLARVDASRKRRKTTPKDDVTMRKLRESEKNGPIRSTSRTEKKFLTDEGHTVDSYMREVGCDRAITEVEVERLRELALEQQEVIEILRQAVKEKERKLEQLSNKRRKEEFYRQWLELEPVAEVDDEEDHEEGDSALSSAPSSLSPQPGGCGQWQGNGVTREAYEAVLIEIDELQSKLLNERQELSTARNQVRDLEKALLQETTCGNRNKELNMLNDKLRAAEEREATLLVELSELREQNELLEFRLLELEETPARRGSPDHTADSGIVSPEPMHVNKEQPNKQRNRAVATVIPYTNSTSLTNSRSASPVPRKPPLSLQESGIFEEEEEDELEIELASRGTQTETPAGELLQEVQRLQELRARIQERAAKVTTPVICPIDQTKICSSLEAVNEMSVDSIVQISSYQERIRELEERLEAYEQEVEKEIEKKRLSKQREEELLDENYRLTERVYWLENELKNIEKQIENRDEYAKKNNTPASTEGRLESDENNEPLMEVESENIGDENHNENKLKDEKDKRCDMITQTEDGGSYEIMKETQVSKISNCTKAVQTIEVSATNKSENCPACQAHDTKNEGGNSTRWTTSETQHPIMIVEEVAKEAKEHEEQERSSQEVDEVDSTRGTLTMVVGSVSQVLVVPEEEQPTERPAEPVVSFTESEPEKKVRQRRSIFREKEGWAMRTWSASMVSNIRREVHHQRRNSRLTLYQEICV